MGCCMRRRGLSLIAFLTTLVLVGCAGRSPQPPLQQASSPQPSTAQASSASVLRFNNIDKTPSLAERNAPLPARSSSHVVALSQDVSSVGERPRDATPSVHETFQVDAYQITVPIGALGRNEALWKQVDEQCVDVATYDLLFKNGLRVGVAPMSVFSMVSDHLPPDAARQKIVINGLVAKKIQLELRKDLVGQVIFYFDGNNKLVGRTYDRSTNFLDLSFQPTPRQAGSVRVDFSPEIRAYRARLEFTLMNEARDFQFVAPETFYDLNCRADIPADHFLILAPSTDADDISSVGHAFLTTDASPVRMEQVIVLVPHVITPEELSHLQVIPAKTAGKGGH